MRNRWTVRLRLTALYGGLFLLAGAALLTITYLLLGQALARQPISAATISVPATGTEASSVPARAAVPADDKTALLTQGELVSRYDLAVRLQQDFRSATMMSLLQQGVLALGGVGVAGVLAAWFAAGRTLRPLNEITATARRVADRNLHQRIGMTGPKDELRRLADTFDDMLARLDAAFETQRRFAANASHELRTPLAINRTLIEVALSHPDPSADVRRLGETLLVINARHERLIDGLLLLARGDHSPAELVPVDLADVVAHVASIHEVTDVTTEPAPMRGDPILLERMVQNLVENAVAYNQPGGTVTVTCGPGRMTVTNTGPVIAAYEIPRLFEPFQRLTDRVGSATGTGLGLSIVRSVARAHGGAVTAEPGPEGGLTVTVDFPDGNPIGEVGRRTR
ncbi:sensor histidine kinase [Paractinoplanes brasiliensis]|uniref:histidine kinase n=1 Tax=Paractinoplanes brasiliensis TaxID=52695 RepID=A0A4R6JQN0_9ACTN|nr:ATP-binding protein [Actinoplanes brasiliensis]TDO36935.1 signal transduction histidine kinase [Actinoplanes brasiliensis]GID30457.1 two-component sensor histidine kinase [Actinoplanes brasiliensis]